MRNFDAFQQHALESLCHRFLETRDSQDRQLRGRVEREAAAAFDIVLEVISSIYLLEPFRPAQVGKSVDRDRRRRAAAANAHSRLMRGCARRVFFVSFFLSWYCLLLEAVVWLFLGVECCFLAATKAAHRVRSDAAKRPSLSFHLCPWPLLWYATVAHAFFTAISRTGGAGGGQCSIVLQRVEHQSSTIPKHALFDTSTAAHRNTVVNGRQGEELANSPDRLLSPLS